MENQDEYNEEVRREVVAEAFEPVLDEILKTNTDDNTDGWPKIWSPISPLKLKFTRLTHPKPKYGQSLHTQSTKPWDFKNR